MRFANRSKVYLVPALADMTDAEIDRTWTTDEDSKSTQLEIVEAIRAMREGTEHDNEDRVCIRGLEHMRSAAHLEQRKINKECVLRAVLDEQEQQWSTGKDDVEEIANASVHNSKWARESAASLGKADAESARRLHELDVCLESLAMANELCSVSDLKESAPAASSIRPRLRKQQRQVQVPLKHQASPSASIGSLLNKRPSGEGSSVRKGAGSSRMNLR